MKANEPPQSPANRNSRARSRDGIGSAGSRQRGDVRPCRWDRKSELAAGSRARPLVIEHRLLAQQSAAVARQGTVGADDAMARHDDAHAVVAVGAPYRANG